jgi:hypothetical protein
MNRFFARYICRRGDSVITSVGKLKLEQKLAGDQKSFHSEDDLAFLQVSNSERELGHRLYFTGSASQTPADIAHLANCSRLNF